METTPLEPFGVRITNVDLNSREELFAIRNLLWKHGVVILPRGAGRSGTPEVHDNSSIVKLGNLFGKIESYHPVNPNFEGTDDLVQVHQTRGNSGTPADPLYFHSDMSWRISPPVASVLCGVDIPSPGGMTRFQSANSMFNCLSDDMKKKLSLLTFEHCLFTGDIPENRHNDVHTERNCSAQHPGLIKHPHTKDPLLYVNRNFTSHCVDISRAESDELLKEIFLQAYCEDQTLTHVWEKNDVVILDSLGVQHLDHDDYDDLRTIHRVVSGDNTLRLERYSSVSIENSLDLIEKLLDTPQKGDSYTLNARQYDVAKETAGYVCPIVAVSSQVQYFSEQDVPKGSLKILDVAAGTGINAQHYLKAGINDIDAMDYSEGMLEEARYRKLYQNYIIQDANTPYKIKDNTYDGIVCCGGFAPHQILPLPSLSEMVRITKSGGSVAFTFREIHKGYLEVAQKIVERGDAEFIEMKSFVGLRECSKITHLLINLKVL